MWNDLGFIPNDAVFDPATLPPMTLAEVLDAPEMHDPDMVLPIPLGRDRKGTLVVHDLLKLSHVLMAGMAGAGKSVFLQSVVASLLSRCTPGEVQLLLYDPTRAEFSRYHDIPHLLRPVLTDPQEMTDALASLSSEMLERYVRFQDAGVHYISGYNCSLPEGAAPMHRIIVVIDELSGLMKRRKKSTEEIICRLAQLGRGAGIHLLVATGDLSASTVTGLIQVNFPTRIAFRMPDKQSCFLLTAHSGAEHLPAPGMLLFDSAHAMSRMCLLGSHPRPEELTRLADALRGN